MTAPRKVYDIARLRNLEVSEKHYHKIVKMLCGDVFHRIDESGEKPRYFIRTRSRNVAFIKRKFPIMKFKELTDKEVGVV